MLNYLLCRSDICCFFFFFLVAMKKNKNIQNQFNLPSSSFYRLNCRFLVFRHFLTFRKNRTNTSIGPTDWSGPIFKTMSNTFPPHVNLWSKVVNIRQKFNHSFLLFQSKRGREYMLSMLVFICRDKNKVKISTVAG